MGVSDRERSSIGEKQFLLLQKGSQNMPNDGGIKRFNSPRGTGESRKRDGGERSYRPQVLIGSNRTTYVSRVNNPNYSRER